MITVDLDEEDGLQLDSLDIDVLPSGAITFRAEGTIAGLSEDDLQKISGVRLQPREITFEEESLTNIEKPK